jgi:hypothetical protein
VEPTRLWAVAAAGADRSSRENLRRPAIVKVAIEERRHRLVHV